MKEALSSGRKADTTHVRRTFQVYVSRPCEYGNDKYVRANYRRPTGGVHHTEPTAEDFRRLQSYARAARDHIDEMLDAMELHLATDPDLLDVEGMKRAAYAIDTDTRPGCPVGPSLLPHVAPACASLMMAITQATDCGLLPRDPGQPWRNPDEVKHLTCSKLLQEDLDSRKEISLHVTGYTGDVAVIRPLPVPDELRSLDAEIERDFDVA